MRGADLAVKFAVIEQSDGFGLAVKTSVTGLSSLDRYQCRLSCGKDSTSVSDVAALFMRGQTNSRKQ